MDAFHHLASQPGDLPATITDILVQLDDVEYRVEDGCLVVRLVERPDYYSGNLVVALDHDPDLARLPEILTRSLAVWKRHWGSRATEAGLRIQWERTGPLTAVRNQLQDAVASAKSDGIRSLGVEYDLVLELAEITPLTPTSGLVIRPLDMDREWGDAVALAIAEQSSDTAFITWQREKFRRMSAVGRGRWWGAWFDDQLVGCAGLFTGHGWARFQEVLTHPQMRRRGVCTNLCHAMITDLRRRVPDARVIIVAEPESSAARIYSRLGFKAIGQQWLFKDETP